MGKAAHWCVHKWPVLRFKQLNRAYLGWNKLQKLEDALVEQILFSAKCAKLCKFVKNAQRCAKGKTIVKICKIVRNMQKSAKPCKILQIVQICLKCAKFSKKRAQFSKYPKMCNQTCKILQNCSKMGLLTEQTKLPAHLISSFSWQKLALTLFALASFSVLMPVIYFISNLHQSKSLAQIKTWAMTRLVFSLSLSSEREKDWGWPLSVDLYSRHAKKRVQ